MYVFFKEKFGSVFVVDVCNLVGNKLKDKQGPAWQCSCLEQSSVAKMQFVDYNVFVWWIMSVYMLDFLFYLFAVWHGVVSSPFCLVP